MRREVEFLFSPTGALTTALFPAGAAGGAVTGIAAGEAARQLGASEDSTQCIAKVMSNAAGNFPQRSQALSLQRLFGQINPARCSPGND